MSSIAAQTYLTPEEYIKAERKATLKFISQDQVHVEHYLRQGKQWVLSEFSALEDVLPLVSIEAELPLRQIYRFVEFETDAAVQTTVRAG